MVDCLVAVRAGEMDETWVGLTVELSAGKKDDKSVDLKVDKKVDEKAEMMAALMVGSTAVRLVASTAWMMVVKWVELPVESKVASMVDHLVAVRAGEMDETWAD